MGRFVNHAGRMFVRLKAVSLNPNRDRQGGVMWNCECVCGSVVTVRAADLCSGATKSCGCLNSEITTQRNTTHGKFGVAGYSSWQGMIQRCTNPNNPCYQYYGGRGITVCERWLHSFESFLEDLGERPSPEHSIDRIDNSRGYYPENCCWSDKAEQANNRRDNHLLTFGGETQTLAEWSRQHSINEKTLITRIHRGWSVEDALTVVVEKQIRNGNRLLTHDGKTQTMAQWSRDTGIHRTTIAARLNRGLSDAEALSLTTPTARCSLERNQHAKV